MALNEVEGVLFLTCSFFQKKPGGTPEHRAKKAGSSGRPLGSRSGVVQITWGQELAHLGSSSSSAPALSETLSQSSGFSETQSPHLFNEG